nr:recombinase family protein [Amycolatopsis sp. DSM 110486]
MNERGVPCPSSADPARNSHRSGARWIVRTVGMILENPRYTGRQVWNRQTTQGHGAGGRPSGRGSGAVRWNLAGAWEVSERLAHAPLVDEDTFIAIQRIRSGRHTKDGDTREYELSGLVVCGVCGRRLEAHWVHGRPGYRCRHGYSTAAPRPAHGPAHGPRNVYVREDHLLVTLAGLLHENGQADDRSPREMREDLRNRGLEILCGHETRELRPAVARQVTYPPTQPDQLPLELDCSHHTGTAPEHRTVAADEHRRAFPAIGERPIPSGGVSHGPI